LKKYLPILKNRYFVSTAVVILYILILHDTDIYTLWNRQNKVADLELDIERRKIEIEEVRVNLGELQDIRSVEKYARENHYFKKDDEDLLFFLLSKYDFALISVN